MANKPAVTAVPAVTIESVLAMVVAGKLTGEQAAAIIGKIGSAAKAVTVKRDFEAEARGLLASAQYKGVKSGSKSHPEQKYAMFEVAGQKREVWVNLPE